MLWWHGGWQMGAVSAAKPNVARNTGLENIHGITERAPKGPGECQMWKGLTQGIKARKPTLLPPSPPDQPLEGSPARGEPQPGIHRVGWECLSGN